MIIDNRSLTKLEIDFGIPLSVEVENIISSGDWLK